jgi:hypothetical protein
MKEYNIDSNNIYNINEKGILMGIIKKVKVLVSKYKKNHYIIQDSSCEWVTLIEYISLGRKVINL